jgi:hypothetical protein
MGRAPKDKHRMRRPQPEGARPTGQYEDDIKKAYSAEQLREIGAIALTWNQVDALIDFLLLVTLKLAPHVWLHVAKRINGMDGKLEILRLHANHSEILTDDAKACIGLSLDAVGEYKGYRDAIVHSHTFDPEKGIAQEVGRRAKVQQV